MFFFFLQNVNIYLERFSFLSPQMKGDCITGCAGLHSLIELAREIVNGCKYFITHKAKLSLLWTINRSEARMRATMDSCRKKQKMLNDFMVRRSHTVLSRDFCGGFMRTGKRWGIKESDF